VSQATVQRQMTDKEMEEHEKSCARSCTAFMNAYLSFPNARNFDLLLDHMRDYQSAWMNGRKRLAPF
jgi:hypothetical protein